MKRKLNICSKCGMAKEDHCIFDPIEVPKNCKCEPREWGDVSNIPDVCNNFEPYGDDKELCKNCEHLKECH